MRVKPGDRVLVIVTPGEALGAGIFEARVDDVTESRIMCTVNIDVPRSMIFDRRTGWRDDREAFLVKIPRHRLAKIGVDE